MAYSILRNLNSSDRIPGQNNLDFLRLVGAVLVLVGHHYVLNDLPAIGAFRSGIHTLGVKIFFAISGYLISKSWYSDPSLYRFAARRIVRIFPALVCVVLVSVFVLGPLATHRELGEYFYDNQTIRYFENIVLRIRYRLPGVFENNHRPGVNGSLWTLPVEAIMYCLVAVVGIFGRRLKKIEWMIWVTIGLLLVLMKVDARSENTLDGLIFYGIGIKSAVNVSVYFVFGSVLFILRRYIPLNPVVGFVFLLILMIPFPGIFYYIEGFMFSYFVLSIGLLSTPIIRDASRFGDFSYGIYLYAFPVQQYFIYTKLFADKFYVQLLFSALVTFIFAYMSWHFLEKRALAFKPKNLTKLRKLES